VIGRTLLHYRITEKLGAGGMGEVWRAADTKLGRHVAIKVLPERFASDKERLARFEREARVLAQLNHSNIAAIYGFEQVEGLHFLVLEYVPGPTLAETLAGGPLEPDEALRIAAQIVDAFEEAHDKGVVHRDLKPANVKVTPEGKVKVLDFGLAKALADEAPYGDPTGSPTLTVAATRAGVILGTAAYMSPEQARGRRLDKRTDIWSFGCVLYELLTGRQAFGGDNITDVIAAIVTKEPDWTRLPATPAAVHRLLRRCLQKDPKDRLRDIADARFELQQSVLEPPAAAPVPAVVAAPSRGPRWLLLAAAAVAGALGAGLTAWVLLRRPPPPAPTMRFTIPFPPGEFVDSSSTSSAVALSPDGAKLVFSSRRGSDSRLYLRAIDQLEAKALPGTEGARNPFFSPDGQWIAFSQDGRLKKLSIAGGAPVALCSARLVGGGAWGPDGTIVFHDVIGAGLWRVSASGGAPQRLTTPKGEIDHWLPHFLPDAKSVLFTIVTGSEDNRLAVLSLETGQRRVVMEGGGSGRYLASGHLVFLRNGVLFAAPFELARLQASQPAVPVVEGVGGTSLPAGGHLALSGSGTLVYVSGVSSVENALVWVDPKGVAQPLAGPRRFFGQPRLSPDGQRVAVTSRAGNPDIWVHQIARGALSRLTVEPGEDETPIWSPDGKTIAYSSSRQGQPRAVLARPADGSGAEQRLWSSDHHIHLNSWSPDGKTVAFSESNPTTSWDLWLLPLDGERKARPFLQTQFEELLAAFSPDGRWLAYQSNETGRAEIYIQPYPGPGPKSPISTAGGTEPLWRSDGRELFFLSGDKMMAVSIDTRSGVAPGTPRTLFETRLIAPVPPTYDVTGDGRRFLMVQRGGDAGDNQLHVVVNWSEELKRRVPVAR